MGLGGGGVNMDTNTAQAELGKSGRVKRRSALYGTGPTVGAAADHLRSLSHQPPPPPQRPANYSAPHLCSRVEFSLNLLP